MKQLGWTLGWQVVRARQSEPAIPRGDTVVPGVDDLLAGAAGLGAVRPPWPGCTLDEVFVYLWSLVDAHRDPDQRLTVAAAALGAHESQAREQLDRARSGNRNLP